MTRIPLVCGACLTLLGCGGSTAAPSDAGHDATEDEHAAVGMDAGADASADATLDASVDASVADGEAGADGASDGPVIVGDVDGGCVSGPQAALDASSCPGGSVLVTVLAPPTWTLFDGDYDSLTFYCPSGARVPVWALHQAPQAQYDCRDCNPPAGVPIGELFSPIPDGGITQSWDGTFIVPAGECASGGMSYACETVGCAAPGPYVALVCACPSFAECGPVPGHGTVCVSVPFEYPAAQPIVVTFPLPDGGSDAGGGGD
jgi:hypothetical protein